jgi:phage tail-like protein
MVEQLPVGMVEDEFFVRFVSIFQEVATTLLEGADNVEHVVDISVAPESMVRWLGSWIGVESIESSLPHDVQRRIVRTSAQMLAWRGTRRGLQLLLEVVSGGPVTIEDGGGVWRQGESPTEPAWVRVRIESTGWYAEQDLVALVLDEVPASTYLELSVGHRRVWPQRDELPVSHVASEPLGGVA